MAVQPQTPYKEYTANGSTKSFALEFDCDNQDHLIVLVDDMEPVVGTWSLSGGVVVFGTAPTSGKKITIQRNTPFRRDEDFQSYDNSFRPPGVNKGFDKIWLKLQELGVADWILSNRINDLRAYVDKQDNVLQDNIDSLKNYVDDKDDELRNYLLNAIQEQGVALDQLEEYYSYLMQQLAQVAIDRGWAASFIVSTDGSTQQEINDFGGAKWWNKPLGYGVGSTVKLENGDIVKSTIPNNLINPNVDMTGWVYVSKNVNSVSELLLLKGSNGNTIKLSSYYAGENKGGGSFYYDSTKLSINNGVTVFNGWVRDLSDKVLTTYNAGLKNDGTDATQKLRTIATNIGANFTVKIFGKHCITSNIMFDSAPNLTIEACNEGSQEGEINAWDLRENWSFDRDSISESEIAVVRISNSPLSTVRCKIRGARKTTINHAQNYEGGDCGVEFKRSPHSLVEDSDLSDFITWAVYSNDSDYTIVQNSKIYNCIRQSGVNIFNGSKHCKVLRNHIYDCGLYGVELECNFSKAITNSNEVAFNTIEKCKWGVGIIDNVGDSQVHSNTIRECFFGVAPTRLSVSEGISISNNKIYACHQGVHVFDSKNITVSGNIVDRLLYTTSIIQDQYSVVLELDGTSSFWTFAWALIAYDTSFVGKQIFINGVSYTITAQQNDPERGIYGSHYGYSGQTKITVDKPVEGVVYDNTLIKVVPPVSTYGVMTGALVGNPINNSISENVVISNNTFTGCTDGMRFASKFASGSLAKEFLYGNTFINCINWVRMAFAMSGYNVGKNTYTKDSVAIILDESVSNVVPSFREKFSNFTPKSSGGSTRIHRSYLKETRTLIGYILHIPNATITGDFQLKVNGSVRHTISASDFTSNADRLFIINKVLGVGYTSGVLNVEVTSADNTLAYNNYELELLFV